MDFERLGVDDFGVRHGHKGVVWTFLRHSSLSETNSRHIRILPWRDLDGLSGQAIPASKL